MRYEFEWDPVKARQNLRKHGVSFERAARFFWILLPFQYLTKNIAIRKTVG